MNIQTSWIDWVLLGCFLGVAFFSYRVARATYAQAQREIAELEQRMLEAMRPKPPSHGDKPPPKRGVGSNRS